MRILQSHGGSDDEDDEDDDEEDEVGFVDCSSSHGGRDIAAILVAIFELQSALENCFSTWYSPFLSFSLFVS